MIASASCRGQAAVLERKSVQSEAVGRGWKSPSEKSLLSASLSSPCQVSDACERRGCGSCDRRCRCESRVVSLLDPLSHSPAGSAVARQAAEVWLSEGPVSGLRAGSS